MEGKQVRLKAELAALKNLLQQAEAPTNRTNLFETSNFQCQTKVLTPQQTPGNSPIEEDQEETPPICTDRKQLFGSCNSFRDLTDKLFQENHQLKQKNISYDIQVQKLLKQKRTFLSDAKSNEEVLLSRISTLQTRNAELRQLLAEANATNDTTWKHLLHQTTMLNDLKHSWEVELNNSKDVIQSLQVDVSDLVHKLSESEQKHQHLLSKYNEDHSRATTQPLQKQYDQLKEYHNEVINFVKEDDSIPYQNKAEGMGKKEMKLLTEIVWK